MYQEGPGRPLSSLIGPHVEALLSSYILVFPNVVKAEVGGRSVRIALRLEEAGPQ